MRLLPAAAGALSVLLILDLTIPQGHPGWVAWLAVAAGGLAGEAARRMWPRL